MKSTLETKDRLQYLIAILILIASIAGTLVAWRSTVASIQARSADSAGLRASLNAVDGQIVNTVYLYDHYRAYTTYRRNYDEALLLDAYLETTPSADDPTEITSLQGLRDQLKLSAESMRWYFPGQYLNGDGSYAIQREWGELFATTSSNRDTNASRHFEHSDHFWRKSWQLIGIFILQMMVLAFLTLANVMHPNRVVFRSTLIWIGAVCIVLSIVAGVIVELNLGG